MIYGPIKGRDSEGRPVEIEIGWEPEGGYFLGIDDEHGAEIVGKVNIIDPSVVLNEVRAYVPDQRRVTMAVEQLPGDDYVSKHPAGDPVARMYQAVR